MITLEQIGRMRLKLTGYEHKLQQAKDIVKQGFALSKNPTLSMSGGKDSVAMLAVVNDVAQELERDFVIWAHLSDASFPGTEEIIKQCAEISNRKLIIDWSPVSAFEVLKYNENVKMFGKKGYFFTAIKNFYIEHNIDLAFVGVRAGESKRRKRAAQAHGSLFRSQHVTADHMQCWPLVWMSTDDICATMVKYNYPIHPIYSKRHPSGDARNIRLGYTTSQDLMYKGTVSFIKDNYPDIYNKLAAAMPEVRAYV